MVNKSTIKSIDSLIDGLKLSAPIGGSKCKCCKLPAVTDVLDRYLERLDAGEDDLPTIRWVHTKVLINLVGYSSVRNHLIKCLGRETNGDKNGE